MSTVGNIQHCLVQYVQYNCRDQYRSVHSVSKEKIEKSQSAVFTLSPIFVEQRAMADAASPTVNGLHVPDALPATELAAEDNSVDLKAVSKTHWADHWELPELMDAVGAHAMNTWNPGSALKNLPLFVRGEGVYLIDSEGRKFIDLTSQVIIATLDFEPERRRWVCRSLRQ